MAVSMYDISLGKFPEIRCFARSDTENTKTELSAIEEFNNGLTVQRLVQRFFGFLISLEVLEFWNVMKNQ